jgi:hypothetical protein
MITIETRALGMQRPLLDPWSARVPADPAGGGGEGMTLRVLIERVVREQVAAFRERQKAGELVRVLSETEIRDAAVRGRVDPGGRTAGPVPDEDAAVAAALAGFQDGLYLVVLDGHEQRDLDALVHPRAGSRMVFVRLAFLAGA